MALEHTIQQRRQEVGKEAPGRYIKGLTREGKWLFGVQNM
jgi:hypothetical protein